LNLNPTLSLRSLVPNDIDFLFKIENDENLWKYSNTKKSYSRSVLRDHIENSKEDIFTAKQQRFVLIDAESNIYGLIDLFDYDHQNSTASIGIVIAGEWRRKGYAKIGLKLLQKYAVKQLNLLQLYACVSIDNEPSRALFRAAGFKEKTNKMKKNQESEHTDMILLQKKINA
tara:strand:+ start:8091 stop:8606 length:516 start_codon:yes stop_codon:yes gene_type:complete